MEIWILGSASEKLKILKNFGEKSSGILLGHKRADSFIVEDLLPLKKIELNSEEFISSLFSKIEFLGFYTFDEKDFENLPQYLYGNVILRVSGGEIKGYFVEFGDGNSPKMIEISVLILNRGSK
jgi:hypothetical protein